MLVSAWRIASAGAKGAQHQSLGVPCQDATATVCAEGPAGFTASVAVADGHGHARHHRSDRGARFAADAASNAGAVLGAGLPATAGVDGVRSMLEEALVPDVISRWRQAVEADLAGDPLSDDDPVIAYGSTLVLVVLNDRWVLGAQIGDGDVVAIGSEGEAVPLVADAPRTDGNLTNSLCQRDAADAFRVGALDTNEASLMAVLLATDGYGNAQIDDPWQPGVAADLARMLEERGGDWVADQLPTWAARCASSDGSGDDVMLALAFRDHLAQPHGRIGR